MNTNKLIIGAFLSLISVSIVFAAPNHPYLEQGGAMFGISQYQQDNWGLLKSVAVNPTNHSATALLTIYSKRDSNLQFARRCWIPAKSKITILSPFYPTKLKKKAKAIDIKTNLIDTQGSSEQILDSKQGLIVKSKHTALTTVIGNNDKARDFINKLRKASGWDKSPLSMRGTNLPEKAKMLSLLSAIVFTDSNLNLNSKQITALRSWVLNGGKIWIMLDATGAKLPRRLLASQWNISLIDKTQLTSFTLANKNSKTKISLDYPINFNRITAPDMKVISKINGHPAILKKNIGQGAIYITTLEAKGLLKALDKNDKSLKAFNKFFAPIRFNDSDNKSLAKTTYASLKNYSRGQIGYKILGRTPVLIILAVLTILLVIIGFIFYRIKKLELGAALGAICAIVAAAILIGLGLMQQSKTPITLSTASLLQIDTSGYHTRHTIAAAVYRPPGSTIKNLKLKGTKSLPNISTLQKSSSIIRLIWNDDNNWHFQGLNLSSGIVHTLGISENKNLQKPISITAHFTSAGIEGELKNIKSNQLKDAVIATRSGAIAPQTSAGKLSADNDDTLSGGQYINASVLSAAQIAHQKAYKTLLAQHNFSGQTMFLGWLHTSTSGNKNNSVKPVLLSADSNNIQATLLAIPIHFQKSKTGSKVSIPSVFLPMDTYRGKGAPSNTIYDPRRRVWNPDISRPQTVVMQYAIPDSVKPLKLSEVKVHLHLIAPGREYKIVTWQDHRSKTLYKGNSLTGQKTIELSGNNLPVISKNGTILLGIHVGANKAGTRGSGWSIEKLQISAKGTTGQ